MKYSVPSTRMCKLFFLNLIDPDKWQTSGQMNWLEGN